MEFMRSYYIAAMLALSIGWGIRGNFGHEAGAMLPGALCAMAICLLAGREDWLPRLPYFALFGALGWAFGGSIAYMPPLGYTHSGHLPTQLYGFFGCFVIGFLWASIGGAGTAYAAAERKSRLAEMMQPLGFVFAVWTLQYFWPETSDTGAFRQLDPYYWLDSEWIEALLALLGLCLFDLWDRRCAKLPWLAVYAGLGAGLGWAAQWGLESLGGMTPLLQLLVHPQGDVTKFDAADLITNFPLIFTQLGAHMGWIPGALAGAGLYFRRYGLFRRGASLLLHMTLGSLIVFLLLPVLLSNWLGDWGGFRLTPPRGDSWANTLGAFLGLVVYMRRNGLACVATAGLVSGVLGGLGLMVAQFVKLLAYMPGNPVLNSDPAVVERWAHWHRANWHSIVTEQGVGLLYGLAAAVPLAWMAVRLRRDDEPEPRSRGPVVFALFFVLMVIPYLNLTKSVGAWVNAKAVPALLRAPLFGAPQMSAQGWFNLLYAALAAAVLALMIMHTRRALPVVPPGWVGRGQLVFVLLLWTMIIGNFQRALVTFNEQRLATEATVFLNGLLVTLLVLRAAPARAVAPYGWDQGWGRLTRRAALAGALGLVLGAGVFTTVVRSVYGDRHDGWGRPNYRFGPEADWRVRPLLKSIEHR
jgi:hypothetical protein